MSVRNKGLSLEQALKKLYLVLFENSLRTVARSDCDFPISGIPKYEAVGKGNVLTSFRFVVTEPSICEVDNGHNAIREIVYYPTSGAQVHYPLCP